MGRVAIAVGVGIGTLLTGVAVGTAGAAPAAGWCSESGDVCRTLSVNAGRVIAAETLAARYYGTATLCVGGPGRPMACRSARVVRRGPVFTARLIAGRRPGLYRMRTYTGVFTLRVTRADLTIVRRTCAPVVDAPHGTSPVTAFNLGCRSARHLVRATQSGAGVAPAGWRYLNPAGCEGVIVRAADAPAVARNHHRPMPGRPSVATVIDRGCTD